MTYQRPIFNRIYSYFLNIYEKTLISSNIRIYAYKCILNCKKKYLGNEKKVHTHLFTYMGRCVYF